MKSAQTLWPLQPRSEGSSRSGEEASPKRTGRGSNVKRASFIPGTVSGIVTGLDERVPRSTLAAIVLHPVHSSSLFGLKFFKELLDVLSLYNLLMKSKD